MVAIFVTDLFKLGGLCLSRSEALRLVRAGGAYIDGERVVNEKMLVVLEEVMVLQKGKKTLKRVIFSKETLQWLEERAQPLYYYCV